MCLHAAGIRRPESQSPERHAGWAISGRIGDARLANSSQMPFRLPSFSWPSTSTHGFAFYSVFSPIVLSFAASDPTGGAGIQADLMTLVPMGCHPLPVVTAVTVQDTVGVSSILALDPAWVEDQARALLEDMPVDAFKIGLLGSADIIVCDCSGAGRLSGCAAGARPPCSRLAVVTNWLTTK